MSRQIPDLVQDIVSQLSSRGETLAIAESCTGGLLSGAVTNLPGVSSVYLGGVVSYADQAKTELLGVPENRLSEHGAVSKEVALSMAHGVRWRLRSSWSVAITGIAGPTGGTSEKPVGTVWISVCGPNFEVVEEKHFKGDRKDVRHASMVEALSMLERALSGRS